MELLSMRVITKRTIADEMKRYSQWRAGIKLWLDVIDDNSLRFESYEQIKAYWKCKSGWNLDRIPARNLNKEVKKGSLDIYVFDVHKNDCRILTWINPNSGSAFVNGVYSHAEYDKWCKAHIK
jgi:mRNA interferase HigB